MMNYRFDYIVYNLYTIFVGNVPTSINQCGYWTPFTPHKPGENWNDQTVKIITILCFYVLTEKAIPLQLIEYFAMIYTYQKLSHSLSIIASPLAPWVNSSIKSSKWFTIWVRQLLYLRKPCWLSGRMFFLSIYMIIISLRTNL